MAFYNARRPHAALDGRTPRGPSLLSPAAALDHGSITPGRRVHLTTAGNFVQRRPGPLQLDRTCRISRRREIHHGVRQESRRHHRPNVARHSARPSSDSVPQSRPRLQRHLSTMDARRYAGKIVAASCRCTQRSSRLTATALRRPSAQARKPSDGSPLRGCRPKP